MGDTVLVYRETEVKLHGPFLVLRVEGKQLFLDVDGRRVQHNLSQDTPTERQMKCHLRRTVHTFR